MHSEIRAPLSTYRWFIFLALVFAAARAVYFAVGLRVDISPIGTYLQYIDPALLRNHLWQSLLYLREQPPGFNLYLGLVLKAAAHPESVLFAVDLLLGLTLAFTLMALMMRLGVANWLAFLLASLFIASPITVLYENWVFYEYPVMVFLVAAAWALERFLRTAAIRDALLFFLFLAVVASVRGVYHLLWFLMLTAGLLWIARSHWKRTMLAAAVPALLIVSFYVKNYAMFGDLIPGEVYRKINFADMVQEQAPDEVVDRLEREGRISGILGLPALDTDTLLYAGFVKQPSPTGIPLLDARRKTTGADNWHSAWTSKVADSYYRDAQVVARACPGLRWRQIRANLRSYLLPATVVFPFSSTRIADPVRPFLNWYERITSGELSVDPASDDDPIAWLNVFLFPACLGGGAILALRARSATILFLLFNITYDSVVTILFACGDHNRYREEVAALYVILIGLLLNAVWNRLRPRFALLSETK